MDTITWDKVKRAFVEALSRPAHERRAFLEGACAGDKELLVKVTALLDAARGMEMSDSPTMGAPGGAPEGSPPPGNNTGGARPAAAAAISAAFAAAAAPRLSEGPGTRIGPYKLLQEIGAGGFGAVYLAEQEQPVRRKVALKIIKLGMDTRQVIARFEAERQALAMMDHANIARVLDAGATEAGRPYFVMELVRGVPVTEYCDTNQLTTRGRLDLFLSICEAVQHAHQKGIIHRDLKPSNVLVTIGDGKPIPKVIDFGIAKATDHRLTEKTLFTEHRQLVGTPEYMSPEQAEMHGLDVDTRTDIYSLGVLLYELLTGSLPFDPAAMRRAGQAEIQRIIRETEPPRPSTRVSRIATGAPGGAHQPVLANAPAESTTHGSAPPGAPGTEGSSAALIARRRQTDPASLRRQLKGDLDWITLKALEKDRTRRYGTASELAQDIRRHLDDLPVLAGPPSTVYRLRKLARRHRMGITAGALILGALVAGLVLATYGLVQANAAADRARTERAKALQTATFLKEMLSGIDPDNAMGRDTTLMREVLDHAAERVERELAGQPEVSADVRLAIGTAYESIGLYDKAEPHLAAALETRRTRMGPEHVETAAAMVEVAYLNRLRGRYAEAEKLYLEALKIRERDLGPEHPDTATCMNLLGVLLRLQGRMDESRAMLEKSLDIRRRVLGPEHEQTMTTVNNLAVLMRHTGHFAEAESLYKSAMEAHRRASGESHPATLNAVSNLGTLYTAMGRYDQAEELITKALAGRERVLGVDHPDTLLTVNNLAALYRASGRTKDAEPLARRAVDTRRRVLGPEHPETLTSMVTLGSVLADLGRFDEAEAMLNQVVEVRRRTLGEEHIDTLSGMNNLATVYFQRGDYERALAVHQRLLDLRLRTIGEQDQDTVTSMFNVGTTLRALKRYAEAEPLMAKAMEGRRKQRGPSHPSSISALVQVGLLYLDMDRNQEAEAALAEGISLSREKQPQGKASFGSLLVAHGRALTRLGRYDDAEKELLHGAELLREAVGDSHKRAAEAARALADLYEAWGKPEKAAEWRAKLPAEGLGPPR